MLQSSILPKLLAKEDITIRHGNYHTAWFDVKNRVLGLPNWKDMGKDVYDLLCGHEVGHALFTPESGWHDSPEKLKGAPRSYLNVIEDARIERDIRTTYPGLVGPMQRGYKELLKREFFGDIYNIDYNELKLIDKINLKTKLGTMIDVPFNKEEKVFLDRAFTNKTWDDVVQLAKDILKYTQENQEELLKPQELPQAIQDLMEQIEELDEQVGEDTPLPQGHDDYPAEEDEENSESADGEESDDCKEDNNNSSESNEDETPSAEDDAEGQPEPEKSDEEKLEDLKEKFSVLSSQPEHQPDADVSETDEAFRENEKGLVDTGEQGTGYTIYNELRPFHIKNSVIGYDQLKKERAYSRKRMDRDPIDPKTDEDFKKYIKECKRSVNFAVKEFEQRKAAFRYTRATTAKTGMLDVNKLWSYKTSEDIFSAVTTLADAKSHGMIMLVDYSGSMSSSMPYVMDQLLHMVHFCKAINIPFDVYGFTTQNKKFNYDNKEFAQQLQDGDIHMDSLSMPLVCSSSFSKSDFIDSIHHMFKRTKDDYWSEMATLGHSENYGSTPLNQALIVSHHLVKEFQAKHRVEKMNFVTFTDGDANSINNYNAAKLEDKKLESSYSYSRKQFAIIQRKKVELDHYDKTGSLLKNMAKTLGVKTMGFFMADDGRHFTARLNRLAHYCDTDGWDRDFTKACRKEYTKNKCVHKENAFGYDNYYLLKGGKQLSAQNQEFEDNVTGDMSDAQIRTAFKKFSKGKKTNKVLMTSIGKEVA